MNISDLGGRGGVLLGNYPRILLKREIHQIFISGQSVPRPKFDLGTSRTKI